MNLTTISVSTLLVGIPAFAGAFLVVSYFGQQRLSSGISMLIFSVAVCVVFAIYAPEARISQGDFGLTAPGALVLGILLGGLAGFISRRGRNNS